MSGVPGHLAVENLVFSNKYVVEHNTDTPDIALDAVVRFFLENELRGHVQNGANTSASLSDVFLSHLLGESEISQFGPTVFLEENVLGLDVPMGDVQVVEKTSGVNNIPENLQSILLRQIPFHLDIIFEIAVP